MIWKGSTDVRREHSISSVAASRRPTGGRNGARPRARRRAARRSRRRCCDHGLVRIHRVQRLEERLDDLDRESDRRSPRGRGQRDAKPAARPRLRRCSGLILSLHDLEQGAPVSASSSHTPSTRPMPRLNMPHTRLGRLGETPGASTRAVAAPNASAASIRAAAAFALELDRCFRRITQMDDATQQPRSLLRRIGLGRRQSVGCQQQPAIAQLGLEVTGDKLLDVAAGRYLARLRRASASRTIVRPRRSSTVLRCSSSRSTRLTVARDVPASSASCSCVSGTSALSPLR